MSNPSVPLDRSAAETVTWDIPRIVSQATSGKLRIPAFQRSFVWRKSDVLKLFDSVYRGFPIGTLLLWARPAPAGTAQFGPINFDVDADPEALWVVDGQQRVTALVGALAAGVESSDERFQIYFDFAKSRFVGSVRGARPVRSIPVREILESRRLLAWLREFGEDLEDEDLQTADAVGGALRDYRIPAYIVPDSDEALLREVFDRVNSAGRPISRAQIFHALFAQGEAAGSPQSVSEELRASGFGKIDENRIVQSLLAIRGGDVARDLHDEFAADEDPSDSYDSTTLAIGRSIEFLKSTGVPHVLLMPTTFPLPVLAVFFHLHRSPEDWTRRLLARWLWRGFTHGFGNEGGQTPALRRAVRTVYPRQGQIDDAPSEFAAVEQLLASVSDRPAAPSTLNPFNTKNATTRLALLAMARRRPLGPDGTRFEVAGQFDERGSDAVGQLVDSPKSVAGSRGYWDPDWPMVNGLERPDVLSSQLISPGAAMALRSRNIEEFVREREIEIERQTMSFLNARIEPGQRATPPISDLQVGEPGTYERRY